jgi:hypothetical protein
MGTLAHFNLAGIRALHHIKSFVETGTAGGDGVEQARLANFEEIHSVEIVPELVAAARFRFAAYPSIQIWEGSSARCLPMILRDLSPAPCLFWLDAHFPGAHHGADYSAEKDAGVRLPLEDEIGMIRTARPDSRDVLLIDDARIYQPGPYSAGDLPPDWPPVQNIGRGPKRLDFVRELYGSTHGVVTDYADQGYVMVFPHIMYKAAA